MNIPLIATISSLFFSIHSIAGEPIKSETVVTIAAYDYSIQTAQFILSSILKSKFEGAQVRQLRNSIQEFQAKGPTVLTAEIINQGDAHSKQLLLFSTDSGVMERPTDQSKAGEPFLNFTFPHFGSEVKVTSQHATFLFRRSDTSVTLVSSAPIEERSEEGGALQPATRPESK